MGIYFLGPTGTFSDSASNALVATLLPAAHEHTTRTPCPTINAVVDATAHNDSWGVIPYYNLIDGLVAESLDRILANNLTVHGALQLPIRIALGEAQGASDTAPIYSHAKALAQCAQFLQEQHPQREQIGVASTAQGVDEARNNNALALGHVDLLTTHGMNVLNPDATNPYFGRTNYTEFLLIGKREAETQAKPPPNRCIIACAPQTDRPGLLADILALLGLFELNLARLHSRPAIAAAPTQLDPQVFYLEIAGAPPPAVLELCADALARTLGGDAQTQVLFDLGSYPLSGANPPST
ncbi:MAG: prephenate dehydratase [Gammaproteobacteria bacterium]